MCKKKNKDNNFFFYVGYTCFPLSLIYFSLDSHVPSQFLSLGLLFIWCSWLVMKIFFWEVFQGVDDIKLHGILFTIMFYSQVYVQPFQFIGPCIWRHGPFNLVVFTILLVVFFSSLFRFICSILHLYFIVAFLSNHKPNEYYGFISIKLVVKNLASGALFRIIFYIYSSFLIFSLYFVLSWVFNKGLVLVSWARLLIDGLDLNTRHQRWRWLEGGSRAIMCQRSQVHSSNL